MSSDQSTDAFELLRVAVTDLYQRGLRTYAAGLKPELQRRTYGGFSETRLGFSSFRAFLEAAKLRGVIDLHVVGHDVAAVPVGAPTQSPAPDPRANERPSGIRPELWRAFLDWTPGLKRYYDRRNDQVRVFPEIQAPLQLPAHVEAREAYRADPGSHVEIMPITRDQQMAWTREFALSTTGTTQAVLLAALATDRPLSAFTTLVRVTPDLFARFNAHRLERLSGLIRRWAETNGLNLAVFDDEASRRHSEEPSIDPDAARLAMLRKKLHDAIDRMPLGELLRLAVPIEYVLD